MNYEVFKENFYILSAIDLNGYKEKQMKRRIDSFVVRNGYTGYEDFISALSAKDKLYDVFLEYITINVTEFYRNPNQWKVFEEEIVPMVLKRNNRPVIWSCACSSGEEPYTIVMILAKYMELNNIKILATDIDLASIKKACEGRYNKKSVENLPKDLLNKYFIRSEKEYIITDKIKKCVEFKKLDLLKDKYPENCDIIVCRNVLIYFTEQAKDKIYKNFSRALKDEGILFVGNTEQIIMSSKYNLKSLRTFFYIKAIND